MKNTYISKFKFKCEKYNPIDKCTIILRQMSEVERNIDSLKSSNFLLHKKTQNKNIFIIFL